MKYKRMISIFLIFFMLSFQTLSYKKTANAIPLVVVPIAVESIAKALFVIGTAGMFTDYAIKTYNNIQDFRNSMETRSLSGVKSRIANWWNSLTDIEKTYAENFSSTFDLSAPKYNISTSELSKLRFDKVVDTLKTDVSLDYSYPINNTNGLLLNSHDFSNTYNFSALNDDIEAIKAKGVIKINIDYSTSVMYGIKKYYSSVTSYLLTIYSAPVQNSVPYYVTKIIYNFSDGITSFSKVSHYARTTPNYALTTDKEMSYVADYGSEFRASAGSTFTYKDVSFSAKDIFGTGSICVDVPYDSRPVVIPNTDVLSVPNIGVVNDTLTLNPDIVSDMGISDSFDNTKTWTDDVTIPGTIPGTIPADWTVPTEVPVAFDFSPLLFDLTTKFPFSIPFDIKRSFQAFNVAPVAPKWTINFPSTYFKSEASITLDFAEFEKLAKIVRWGILVTFSFGLIVATRKIIS